MSQSVGQNKCQFGICDEGLQELFVRLAEFSVPQNKTGSSQLADKRE